VEGRRIWNKTLSVSEQRTTERPLPLVISALRAPTLGLGKNGIPLHLPLFRHTAFRVLTAVAAISFAFFSFGIYASILFEISSYIN